MKSKCTKQKQKKWMSLILAGMIGASSVLASLPTFASLSSQSAQTDMPDKKDEAETARVYVNNIPIRLEVAKMKTPAGDYEGLYPDSQEDSVTYKWTGRVDGSITNLIQTYGSGSIELAYAPNGTYLGYGWKKGTLEYLQLRKEKEATNNETVEIKYNEYGIFEGYAYITKKLETADNENRYVAGAVMTLFDAIEVFKSPYATGDDRFPGITVIRDSNGDVTSAFVNKGYAGSKVEYVLDKGDEDAAYHQRDEINDSGNGTWIAKTIDREDSPILYYNLNDLIITTNATYHTQMSENQKEIDRIFGASRYDKEQSIYGLNRAGEVVNATQKDEFDFTIFAFRKGDTNPVFEFEGGNFKDIHYNALSKVVEIGNGTTMYHLDNDGNRDAKVDPQTGIAYITEDMLLEDSIEKSKEPGILNSSLRLESYQSYGRIYVWPVNIYKDRTGSQTFEKIKTSRLATINEDTEDEYTIGTYTGSELAKKLKPTYGPDGLPIYYERSDITYEKGEDRYDRDGDYLGYSYQDYLNDENKNAYQIKDHEDLYNGDDNNPFDQGTQYQYSSSLKIKLTIDIDGNYIVNGAETVPIPRRDNRVFAGWLLDPSELTDGGTINALWRVAGSTMDESQRQKWYSDRPATGETQTIVVTFMANGGEFFDDSGAIHSADNKLYHRQGEAYVIENTWISGEATPNNPFSDRIVNRSANDPYYLGNDNLGDGGKVDVIKRVFPGKYIMEELSAPMGYTKGLPVGVNVEKSDSVQMTEMVDTTIKVEISKVDAPDNDTFHIYKDGELATNPAGIKDEVVEPKGSYSYGIVPDAKLAIFSATNDEVFKEWVKETSFVFESDKYYDEVYGDYIVVDTSNPIYIEGFPAGEYIISEIDTPPGYVTAPDTKVKISKEKDVQLILINDDHTKLEIRKYQDDESNQIMPNMYRAGLELKDESGNVIAKWQTDDISFYQEFMKNYQTMVEETRGAAFTSISWNVTIDALMHSKSSTKELWILSDGSRILIEDGVFPANASQEFIDTYLNRNMETEEKKLSYTLTKNAVKESGNPTAQFWRTDEGNLIHICVYEDNEFDVLGRQKFICEYKFNYQADYTGIYKNMVSYDTIDGLHRFDFIPTGSYILHESDVPEGFMQADDKIIEVKETGDIQQYSMANKQRELIVTKVAEHHSGKYYAGIRNQEVLMGDNGIEIAGAKLQLYRIDKFSDSYKEAFKAGLVPEDAELITEWISGSDGVYTEEDYRKETIPSGYQVGDLKPHSMKDLDDGYYYLVEVEAPEYYHKAEPIELEVSNQKAELFINNKMKSGKVSVFKNNKDGKGLPGAVFTVRNRSLETVAGYIITDDEGRGSLIIDEIGRMGANGVIEPYTFTIEETSPPAGYQINIEVHDFMFDGTGRDDYAVSYNINDASHVNGIITVTNDVTAITISKSDFDSHLGVPGAKLVIYQVTQEEGHWKATGDALDTWTTTSGSNTHVINGLVGSGNYVLIEELVPEGYIKAEDIFFRISSDGKGISRIWTDPTEDSYIGFSADNTGAVEQVDVVTRTYAGSKTLLWNMDTDSKKEYGTATNGFTLTASEITEGHTYRMDEIVKFTDGAEVLIRSTTFVAQLEDGFLKIHPKHATAVENVLINKNGTIIANWKSDDSVYSIKNPLLQDEQELTIKNTQLGNRIAGQNHEAVSAGQQLIYTIRYKGNGKNVTLIPDSGAEIIRTEPAAEMVDGLYQWITKEEEGEIRFIAMVKEEVAGKINQRVLIDETSYTYMNPIAVNEGTGFLKDTSKIVLFNDVKGNDPSNLLKTFTYRITLTNAQGNPLSGSYTYRSKNDDEGIKVFEAFENATTFDVSLSGTDYIVISDLPYGTKYSVKLLVTDDFNFSVQSGTVNDYGNPINLPEGVTSKEQISNIYFSNTRNLSNERQILKRNESYEIVERVLMNDETRHILTQRGFTLGENCEVVSFDMTNRKYPIVISKRHITGEQEVPGARLQLLDMEENILEEWISSEVEYVITSTLIPGTSYILRELAPPDGYAYSSDIVFTVNPNGTINRVIMYDAYTKVYIDKVDKEGKHVIGAKLQIKDSKGLVIEEWISNGKRHEITNKLTSDETYTLIEVHAPDGYRYANAQEFKLGDKSSILLTMVDEETKVLIVKESSELDEKGNFIILDGTILQILDENKNPVTAIKDTADFAKGDLLRFTTNQVMDITGLLNAETTYYLNEVKPVDGYAFAKDIRFTVPKNASVTVLHMTDEPIITKFIKTNQAGDEILSGAQFKLIHESGTVIDQWTSTNEAHVINKKLIAGESYTLIETVAPDGYSYIKNITFRIQEDGSMVINDEVVEDGILFIKDKPTKVWITKLDITNEEELPGAYMAIKDKDGTVIEWISTNEPYKIVAKLIAGETYYLEEILPPDGYSWSETIEFTVSKDGTIDKIVMKDKPTQVEISKSDITTGEELKGAHLQIIDSENPEELMIIEEWISNGTSHVLKKKLTAGKSYILREVSAPDGYVLADDISFTVNKNGKIDKVVMEDRPTIVEISKLDITGDKELPGAFLQIIDKAGGIVEEWKSTDQPHMIQAKLIAGEIYVLHEEMAPDGYAYAVDIEFRVSEDGSIDKVVMVDKPTHVEILKKDANTGKPLEGAHLQILDKDKTIIEEWISTNKPHRFIAKLIAGESYVLHEVNPPDGYGYMKDIPFTVSKDGSIDEITMMDKPTWLEISKKDITGDEELPGAHLQIIDMDGAVIEEWVSTRTPHIIKGKLIAGESYILQEVLPPDGYGYANDIKFTISLDGTIDKVTMYDEILKISVIKWKNKQAEISDTGNMLGGAKMQIKDSTGLVVDEWVTEEGIIHEIVGWFPSSKIPVKPDEVYTVSEIEVPAGWIKAKDQTFTAAHDGTVKIIHVVDQKKGNPDKPDIKTPTITISKNDAANLSVGVAGAEYTIYHPDGSIYLVIVTGADGKATFTRPANGTYTYKETKSPDGYMIDETVYSFTVSSGIVSGTLNVKDWPETEIEITKKDGKSFDLLPGALIEVYDSKGKLVAKGETGLDGVFPFIAKYDDTYTAVEVRAPKGYQLKGKTFVKLTIKEGRLTGETTMYNYKDEKIGTITASYDSGINGKGYAWLDKNGKVHFGKTGDSFNLGLLLAGCVIATGGFVIILRRRKKDGEK